MYYASDHIQTRSELSRPWPSADPVPDAVPVDDLYRADCGWRDLSHAERVSLSPECALRRMCEQISHDYSLFFKRHVASRLRPEARLSQIGARTLICLGSFGRPMTNSEVAEILRSAPASVSRGLAQLEQRDYIERAPCPHDGRAVCVTLTQAGRAAYSDMMEYWEVAIAKAELLTGLALDPSAFEEIDAAFHTVKDRARAFVDFRPGRASRYQPGMSRPSYADRHSARRAYSLKDSYLRFYADIAAQDYKRCWMQRVCKPILAAEPITVQHLDVLMCASLYPVDPNLARLAKALRCDPAKVSRARQALEEGGYIETLTDPDDDRIVRVSMTRRGNALTKACRERTARLVERVDLHLSMQTTSQHMDQLVAAVKHIQHRAETFAALKTLPTADLER